MSSFRSFLSIPAPPQLQTSAAEVIRALQSVPSGAKWERPEKLHITMKFLGTVDESMAGKMSDILRTRIGTLGSFMVTYSGVGAFPAIGNPRVVWIGAEGSEPLHQLFSAVEEVCTSLGFPRETRTFHAHVTIGRVKSLQRPNRLTAILKSVTFEPIVARCSELCIMKSELHPTGSQYTVVQSIPLKL